MIFIFLDTNQVDGITTANGLDTGGTVLTVTVTVDQTLGDIWLVYWSFPASESVSATPSPPFNYLWTPPVFDQTLWDSTYDWKPELSTNQNTLDNMMIVMYPDYAIVQIGVIIVGNVDKTFQFTYNRNVEVDGFEPPFRFYNQSYSIVINGVNFHPHVNIMWKHSLDTVTTVY